MPKKATQEKKAVQYYMAGNYKAATRIYKKLADTQLDIDWVCKYLICSQKSGEVDGTLPMINKYVDWLKWEVKPEYKNFYLQAANMTLGYNMHSEAVYLAKKAEQCDATDDAIFLTRLICECALGFPDNARKEEARLLNLIERFCKGEFDDDFAIPVMAIASWFADSQLLYRVTKQSAVIFNKIKPFAYTPKPDAMFKPKIKIGYLSSHVREHPAMHISWDHFAQHNSERFETHGFFQGADYSYKGAKAFADSLDGYSDIDDMSDREAAHYIKDMGIDILVDLSSMVEGSREGIVAHKPAPIIMHYQGYYGTTGLDAVDYKITDLHTTPISDIDNFSEKMAYLPVFAQTSQWKMPIDKSLQERSKWGLPKDAFVFGNMCAAQKYTPEMLDAWMVILGNVENSVLWIAKPNYNDTQAMIHFYADKHGIDKDRIIFAPRVADKDEHMSRIPCMDIHLDTNIFCGHTTTFDMVEMGVFPLCMQGTHCSSRFSASILYHAGCGQMVAGDIDEYIQTAIVLGRDKELTQSWSDHLYKQATDTGLFDTKGLIVSLENAYETAYIRWASGLAPDHFMAESVSQDDIINVENTDYLVSQENHEDISAQPARL